MDECDHHWESQPGETITYVNEAGQRFAEPARGMHQCIKRLGHVDDPTDDDHRCCCGASTWVTEAKR